MLDGLCTAEVDKGYNKLFTDHVHLLELRGQLNKSSPSKSFLSSVTISCCAVPEHCPVIAPSLFSNISVLSKVYILPLVKAFSFAFLHFPPILHQFTVINTCASNRKENK